MNLIFVSIRCKDLFGYGGWVFEGLIIILFVVIVIILVGWIIVMCVV